MKTKTKTSKTRKSVKELFIDPKDIKENLGECHDGEEYKLLMKDGSIRNVPKRLVDEQ
ncbi:MAG: hypothetical protein V1897_19150 [Pseudomonadota bacterium]